mgnify:CR=1 FL=1
MGSLFVLVGVGGRLNRKGRGPSERESGSGWEGGIGWLSSINLAVGCRRGYRLIKTGVRIRTTFEDQGEGVFLKVIIDHLGLVLVGDF